MGKKQVLARIEVVAQHTQVKNAEASAQFPSRNVFIHLRWDGGYQVVYGRVGNGRFLLFPLPDVLGHAQRTLVARVCGVKEPSLKTRPMQRQKYIGIDLHVYGTEKMQDAQGSRWSSLAQIYKRQTNKWRFSHESMMPLGNGVFRIENFPSILRDLWLGYSGVGPELLEGESPLPVLIHDALGGGGDAGDADALQPLHEAEGEGHLAHEMHGGGLEAADLGFVFFNELPHLVGAGLRRHLGEGKVGDAAVVGFGGLPLGGCPVVGGVVGEVEEHGVIRFAACSRSPRRFWRRCRGW